MNAKSLLEATQSSIQKDNSINVSRQEKAYEAANVNKEILSKVESMIATKKKPEKVFQNHPPRKEVPRKDDQSQ